MVLTNKQTANGFDLTNSQYKKLSRIIYDSAGIHLGDNKKELVHARLSKMIRRRKLSGFREYIGLLHDDASGDELTGLLDAIATNVTHFFRENSHFEFLVRHMDDRGHSGGLRIWSAGCSSGEEPYSLAILLREHILKPSSPQPHILATDISTKILQRAVNGVYPMKSVDTLDRILLRNYFLKGKNSHQGVVQVKKELTDIVNFERLNLMEPFSFEQKFDVIFCRNVMIYFDSTTRQALINKFYDALNPGGYFIIGHSESLNGIQHTFRYIQPTIYRRKS